ncbi:hypothetical protein ACSBR1_014424 [Camellia fascicularis]
MESRRAELEVLREQRQSDHEELLKEKEECQRDREELLKEKEERRRDREEIMREREQLIKQVDEEKKALEAQQVQLNHLNDVVLRHNVSRHCSSRPGVLIHYTKDRNLISIG